jgi:WD40 repeat protein
LLDEGSQLHIWDSSSGEEVRWLGKEHCCLALSRDGSTVASPTDTGLLLWDPRTGKPVKRIDLPQPRCWERLAFSAHAKFLVGSGGAVHVWDVCSGREVNLLKLPRLRRDRDPPSHPLTVLAFSPNDSHLAAVFDRYEVHVWDLSSGKRVRVYQGHEDEVIALTWSPDGKRLASVGEEGAVHLWDDASLDEVWRVIEEGAGQVAFAPDGKTLATGGKKGIRLWDVKTGKAVRHFSGSASHVAFAPDGKTLAAVAPDGRVQIRELLTGKVRLTADPPTNVRAAVFNSGGHFLTVGHSDGTVLQADPATGKVLRRFPGPKDARRGVVFAPDCKTLAIPGQRDGEIKLWDVMRSKELRHWIVPGSINLKGFSPDGRLLAVGESPVGDDPSCISLWNVGTGGRCCRLEKSAADIDTIGFSPDGRTVAAIVVGVDGYLALWETTTGKRRRVWPRQGSGLCHCFAGDGRRLAVSDWGHLQLLDVSSKRISRDPGNFAIPESGPRPVLAVTFSPNGKLVAWTSGYDHYVYLSDTVTGEYLDLPLGHRDVVRALAFSADGKRLVSGGDDGLAFVWDVQAVLSKKKPKGKP